MLSWIEAPLRVLVFIPLYAIFAVLAGATHTYRRWMSLLSGTVLLAIVLWLVSAYGGNIILFRLPDGFFLALLIFFLVWSLIGRILSMRAINQSFVRLASVSKRNILCPLPPDDPVSAQQADEEQAEKVEYVARIMPVAHDDPPTAARAFAELPSKLQTMILSD